MPKKKKQRQHAIKEVAIPPSLEDGQPPAAGKMPLLGYPIGDEGIDALEFIKRAAERLKDPETAIYLDTSFLMWLTKGGNHSRQQFIDWAQTAGDRIHVPLWTFHEYYRHHARDTLRGDLAAEAKKLKDAAKQYATIARTYADNQLKFGMSDEAFGRDLKELEDKIQNVTASTAGWDYNAAAKQVRDWMSERLCRSKVVFDLMDRIGQTGEARYTQDVPPGYMDRVKIDAPDKGSNKFGDLIMWEEMLAHMTGKGMKNVVLLTRDRKFDWFARADAPKLEAGLERLTRRWEPVPAPHPTLVLELLERTQAKELVLLDNLYFGAVLHHLDKPEYSRLIAYAIGISSTTYTKQVESELPGPKPDGGVKDSEGRPPSAPLTSLQVARLCQAASVPAEPGQWSAPVIALMNQLRGDLPTVERSIQELSNESLGRLSVEDAAQFARSVADEALLSGGHLAQAMANRIVALLPNTKEDVATGICAGLLASAYYDGSIPRVTPKAWDLQAVFDQLGDAAYTKMIVYFGKALNRVKSVALFNPKDMGTRLDLRFAHDGNQEQSPMVLQQISLGEKNLLTEVGPSLPGNLFALMGKRIGSASDLMQITAKQFGLPMALLSISGCEQSDQFTLPVSLGFITADDMQTVAEVSDVPSDAVLEAMPMAQLTVPSEEQLEAAELLDEDPDE